LGNIGQIFTKLHNFAQYCPIILPKNQKSKIRALLALRIPETSQLAEFQVFISIFG